MNLHLIEIDPQLFRHNHAVTSVYEINMQTNLGFNKIEYSSNEHPNKLISIVLEFDEFSENDRSFEWQSNISSNFALEFGLVISYTTYN